MELAQQQTIEWGPERGLVSARTLADQLDVHLDTIRRWRRTGRISRSAWIEISPGCYRYSRAAVLNDLQER